MYSNDSKSTHHHHCFKFFFVIAKETPKAPATTPIVQKTPQSNTHSHDDDDIVEYLDDDEDDLTQGQLGFDIAAMNFGPSIKAKSVTSSNTKASTTTTTKTSTLKVTAVGTSLLGSDLTSPVESAPPSGVSTPTKASTKAGKRIDVISEYQKRLAEKESLNLVVIGKGNVSTRGAGYGEAHGHGG